MTLGMQDFDFPKSNQICPNLINFGQKIYARDVAASPAPMALSEIILLDETSFCFLQKLR